MNCQWIARHGVKMLGCGRRDVLEEMNTVVQSGLLSLTKERFQFIHVLFPATLDTCAGHRRPVVPSPLTGFWGERRAAYTPVEGRIRCRNVPVS